jgi:hypothetical protein
MNTPGDMSGRVNVVLPDEVYDLIKRLAEAERRSQSQMTAFLVEEALIARGILPKKEIATPPSPSTEEPKPTKKGGK